MAAMEMEPLGVQSTKRNYTVYYGTYDCMYLRGHWGPEARLRHFGGEVRGR